MAHRQSLMLTLIASGALATLGGCGSSRADVPHSRQNSPARAGVRHPVVVELFQSQGCSSCPPANAYLNILADRSDILTLSFAVTYWDRLGWKDTFGSPQYTTRQQDYAQYGTGEVGTPEFIVDGSVAVVGSNRQQLDAAISRAKASRGGPEISFSPRGARIAEAATTERADVWLVRYDPQSRAVPIRAGENGGRTLPHRHIVRQLARLGTWTGAASEYRLPAPRETGLETVILVQRSGGGPIIAASRL